MANAVPWTAEDGRRWRAAGLRRWLRPEWSAIGWTLACGFAIGMTMPSACGELPPCERSTFGEVAVVALTLANLVWALFAPRAAAVGAVAVLILALVPPSPEVLGNAVVLTPFCIWTLCTVIARERARPRQITALPLAPPVPALAPEVGRVPKRALQPGRGIAALVVVAAGAGLIAFGGQKQQVEDAHWERSAFQTATVVARNEADSRIRVLMANGDERDMGVPFLSDFAVGESVDVRVDGAWARVEWYPYDAMGWYAGGLLVIFLGAAVGVCHLWWRRELRRLERNPVPSLAVTLMLVGAKVEVFPLGDSAGRRLLRFRAITLWSPPGEEPAADLGDGSATAFSDKEDWAPQIVDGILYGNPCEGAALTVRIGDHWLISEAGVRSLTGFTSHRRSSAL
ncbi:hypothetical protein [Actinomadura sp. HBU206391]|uniref:hypothetical protein n=1 Tax=Actinomadura sp. HBU206391 TaxID=2731692 RepID=UPI00164FFEA3|nr:hypothetical protein [Actinomadura sp. HBU206391]MBC6456939.1 hypothetical protein [Actinomadura sp. HBU206391]